MLESGDKWVGVSGKFVVIVLVFCNYYLLIVDYCLSTHRLSGFEGDGLKRGETRVHSCRPAW